MNMHYVNSSNLVSVGYNPESSILRIQFKSGVYDYYNVPESTYLGLMNASSKGQYHHMYIKNSYDYKKIG